MLVLHGVLDLIECLFGDEAFVSVWVLAMYGARMEGRQQPISKAAVVRVFDYDDCCSLDMQVGS